jgi:diketogulonate reductase-like aldo/keto reductase
VPTARIEQDFSVFSFDLIAEEMQGIDSLDVGRRIGSGPDMFIRP